MRIAADTNVLLDQALDDRFVTDALATIRRRLRGARVLVVPTVLHELALQLESGRNRAVRLAAAVVGKQGHTVTDDIGWGSRITPRQMTLDVGFFAQVARSNVKCHGVTPCPCIFAGTLALAEAVRAVLPGELARDDATTALAGRNFAGTLALAEAVRAVLPAGMARDDTTSAIRRVFQTVRIAVNEEFSALEALLRALPQALQPSGRVVVLSFHSGEDRRVKKAFQSGYRNGHYASISAEVIRPTAEECRANTRASPAKLRWAVRSNRG